MEMEMEGKYSPNPSSALDPPPPFDDEEDCIDSMVCDSGSRLVPGGFTTPIPTDEVVLFVNAGAEVLVEAFPGMNFLADNFFQGGDVFRTNDGIAEGGDFPIIYQSARLGNFSYRFDNIPPGDYFVDLHFVEIIFTHGPRGMRSFDVFLQDEKILSDFDIFSIVGANKPLRLIDLRVSIMDSQVITIRFEAVNGSPVLSGICIRRAPKVIGQDEKHDYIVCHNCASEVEVSSYKKKYMHMKSVAKYEKTIQTLSSQCQQKSDECHQAWMSYSDANEQLEKVKMELDMKLLQANILDQMAEKQSESLRDISSRYDHDKKTWIVAIKNLEQNIKVMKHDHFLLSEEAHRCADSLPELNNMMEAVHSLVAQCEDLKMKYSEEQAKRRKLHNQVEEAKGNIRVFCRCRPLSKAEALAGCSTVVDFHSAKDGELGVVSSGTTKKSFKFDQVFTPTDDQVDVFAHASPMVTSVLDGYNVCIFAYGQTGTGKTFTMEGTVENRGVNYRTLEELFRIAKERSETFTYNISVSVLEVYNEQIRDLLSTQSSASKKLEIKQASEGFHHIPGIVEAKVENTKEVWNVLQTGSCARAVESNNVNEHSSRSHCMLCITVRAKNLINGECTRSKLWLVDLAGSERIAKTDAQGDRLKEAQNINRSLSALGDVISALANKSGHIPYRNSKLTHILQDSLGGDSKTLMFVQISPSEQDLSETMSSLNFATRVRGVELGPARKQIDTSELQKMKMLLDKARQESRSKDESLKKLEEALQNLEGKARGKDQICRSHLERIKELEGQIELKTLLHSQSEKQVSHLSERLIGMDQVSSSLHHKVQELEGKLKKQEKSDSTVHQEVRELKAKLQLQVQESTSHSISLQRQIEELERKLKEAEYNSEHPLLHQKIKELEEKVREKERQLSSLQSTSCLCKQGSRDEHMNQAEHHILRVSNSNTRQTRQRSDLLKENKSSDRDIRRKRLSRNNEIENATVSATCSDNRSRDSVICRAATVVTKPVTTAQRPITISRTNNPAPVNKERENKKRMWSR